MVASGGKSIGGLIGADAVRARLMERHDGRFFRFGLCRVSRAALLRIGKKISLKQFDANAFHNQCEDKKTNQRDTNIHAQRCPETEPVQQRGKGKEHG